MLETAKSSSWQENLRNAADAQERFMIPGNDADNGRDTPDYIKKIDKRSSEILQEERDNRNKEIANQKDPSRTKFW